MTERNHSGAGRTAIGVFDSGFGGLTVLHALLQALPGADFIYLGDTARLPYGSKSQETVTRYTGAAIDLLVARGVALVVIACNTASALALPSLAAQSKVPLVGVIEPGAAEAARVLAANPVGKRAALVLATVATVESHAYRTALATHGIEAHEKACPLLVPLAEEGWTDHAVTAQTAYIYLRDALHEMRSASTEIADDLQARSGLAETAEQTAPPTPALILLGCTHYPLLRPLLERTAASVMPPVPMVDAAAATAAHVRTLLPHLAEAGATPSNLIFLATDSPAKFQRLGERFLRRDLDTVELVSLDEGA